MPARTSAKYVDGFVLVVPKKHLAAYRAMARGAAKIWRKHGALDYKECLGDDLIPSTYGTPPLTFPKLTKLKPSEVVVFAYITYTSRAHRDRVNAKVMKDPSMHPDSMKDMVMPFDMKRMAFGGFSVFASS